MESSRDLAAMRKLRDGRWLSAGEQIILDVDLDFFGVEAVNLRFEQVSALVCVLVSTMSEFEFVAQTLRTMHL